LVLIWYYKDMVDSKNYFLGIDGGGSRCRARIRDANGDLLAEALGGSANVYQDFDKALSTILETSNAAAAKANIALNAIHAGLGLAGLVTSVDGEKLLKLHLPFASVVADNDAAVACLGAFNGQDGGIVIAGTGSIGFGMQDGTRHMVGGWGFALGDHGSGAWVGHHAARRAALVIDGLLQPTPLIEKVMAIAGNNRRDLTHWSEKATPKEFAQFAPAVFQCAEMGDVLAMTIVIEGASAISNLGRALLARGCRQLCLLGGLSKVYLPYLDADMLRSLVTARADAVDGAILMSRKAQGLGSWITT
jgi:glucosamine kinase